MLRGFWPAGWKDDASTIALAASAVGGGVSVVRASAVVVGSRFQQQSSPLTNTLLLMDSDDGVMERVENDDEKANRLLVQFPTYGSYSQALNANNLNPTADWLLGGTSNIPNPSQQQQQQQQQLQQQQNQNQPKSGQQQQNGGADEEMTSLDHLEKQQSGGANSSSRGGVGPNASAVSYRDWDEDEQKLWRTTKALPTKKFGDRQVGGGNTDGNTAKELKNQKHPPEDFLDAYYYHIGVKPKHDPPRSTGWAGDRNSVETTPKRFTTLPRSSFAFHSSPDRIGTASMDVAGENGVDDGDDDEQMRTPGRGPPSPPTTASKGSALTPTGTPVKTESTAGSNSNSSSITAPHDDRQHWMPDQLCKHCYACDTPFTVFRRRHHCRLCGQVFCNSCSGFFVPASQQQLQQQQLHQQQLQQQHPIHPQHSSPTDNNTTLTNVSNNNAITNTASAVGNNAAANNKTILRTCKMCYEQVVAQQQMIVDEEAADERKRKKKEDPLASASAVVVADGTTKSQLSTPLKGTSQQHPSDSPSLQDQLKQRDSVLHTLSKKRPETESTKRRLLSQQQAIIEEEKHQADLLLTPRNKRAPQEPTQSGGMALPSSPARTGSATNQSHDPGMMCHEIGKPDARMGNRRLGLTAAMHLEKMGEVLLESDAPLLLKEIARQAEHEGTEQELRKQWINKIMSLATRCCATVEPNVKKGDLLDIRPYCKIKVIPGGSCHDSAYMSGILFRKTLSHKRMTKEIENPRIMLLSGGIEFTRTENRIASLDTLLEQEDKYIEILVGKIIKLKPDILMVGRSVSRRAQELLLKARVVLLQHVKSSLLSRISRQTGATVISSTDHIMNQFGAHVLGRCHRFRFIVARDNEIWIDKDLGIQNAPSKSTGNSKRNIQALLGDTELSNHERQAVLAANMLGQAIIDGSEAVKCGLSKRGVATTYCLLEGCPKQLGCTVVLRGASRAALKQLKGVFRFLVNVAYNLRLETSYFKERCVGLHPDFEVRPQHLYSSSLCVDYGRPAGGRKVRPWNGGTNNEGSQRSMSGQISAFDHQSILITSVWMTDKTQCCPAEVKGICYYSLQDVSLGQFLRDSCFNLSLKCQNPTCKKSVLDHSLSFVHNDGLINIAVDHMDDPLPPPPRDGSRKNDESKKEDDDDSEEVEDSPIATWTYCKSCGKVVTPLIYISENTWKYSFGKFLESFFYNRDAVMNSPEHGCSCGVQGAATLFFGCGRLAARFTYERVRPFGVFVRRSLEIDTGFHRAEALRHLGQISMASSQLFVKFDKHIEKVSREARLLFGSAANRPEHLQTVLMELNKIGSEVDHAAKTLQEKIASVSDKCSKDDEGVVNEALFRFPWFSRRYLFMLTSAWNEKLSAAGQAIVAMKKLATSASQRGDSVMGPNVPAIVGDPNTEELFEGMRRLRQLHEVYSRYNLTDITTVLPILPGATTPGREIEYDDDFEDPDGTIDFAEGVDADVLASRRRLGKPVGASPPPGERGSDSVKARPTKSLGTRRPEDRPTQQHKVTPETIPNATITTKVTPGGAVKSAITRFFNRGGRESDPYIVDLGIFNEGRPRLEAGVNGIVVPVLDDQLCTVIAYSLSSTEYDKQFQIYYKIETAPVDTTSDTGHSSEANLTSSGGAGGQQRGRSKVPDTPSSQASNGPSGVFDRQDIERRMLIRNKSHIKHTFRDFDEKGQNMCKFVCTTYWATQFQAVRQIFLAPNGGKDHPDGGKAFGPQGRIDVEQSYVQSLSSAYKWAASGGKSGASFARTSDDRFVIKCISRTELQMFLDCAPAYFEYLSKAFFHGLPTVLCKIVGVYQIGYHNRVSGKRTMDQVAVMQNIFYNRKITMIFDLKGSLRGRFAAQVQSAKDDGTDTPTHGSEASAGHRKRGFNLSDADMTKLDGESEVGSDGEDGQHDKDHVTGTLLDGDFLDFTNGRPMPMNDRAKAVFHMSILNDTLFLSIINVLDYSILVGIDEERMELVVGIIDFMRQYDILKQMERVGKSLPMVVGSEAPTIIQPPLYKARFTNAMERYFMTVPSKWTTI